MPTLLESLVINRVDLVSEGANSAAFVELIKRKEKTTSMTFDEVIAKLKPEHAEIVKAEVERLNEDITKSKEAVDTLKADKDTLEATLEKMKKEDKQEEDDIFKGMDPKAVEVLKTFKAQKEAAEEELRKSKDAKLQAEAVAKAATLKALPVEQEKLVGIVKSASPELLDVLSSINTAISTTVLEEVGKNKTGNEFQVSGSDAWGKIEKKADEVAKRDNITKSKAIGVVITEEPDLYNEYLKGGAN